MWNNRFGMMRAGVGGTGPVNSTKARAIATSWLATNRAGTTLRAIDPYPGYFTLDLQSNGAVSGMMSVSSVTGAAWYHGWHGTSSRWRTDPADSTGNRRDQHPVPGAGRG